MIRNDLSHEYRRLGEHFLEADNFLNAADCATKAILLDQQSAKARDLLARVASCLAETPGEESRQTDSVSHLEGRRDKLNRFLATDPGLSILLRHGIPPRPDSSHNGSILAPGSESKTSVDLKRRLDHLLNRMKKERKDAHIKIIGRLQNLADRLSNGIIETKAQEGPSEYDGFFELSLEHELHNLANDFYKIDDFQTSEELYSLALELKSDLPETYFNRALSFTRMKKYRQAREDLNKVISMNPKLAEAYYTRGLVYEHELDYDHAIADYDKALEIDPDYGKAENQKSVAQQKRREKKSAGGVQRKSSDSSDDECIKSFAPYVEKPECTFEDVAAREEIKEELKAVVACINGHEAFTSWGSPPPRGVILYGPPGTGKTLLARAVAGEAKCPFLVIPSTAFLNMYYGNTTANIRRLFDEVKSYPRCLVFFDEFDILGSKRTNMDGTSGDDCHNRTVGCLLSQMDGFKKNGNLVIMAATNRLGNIDEGFLRPGRFNCAIEVSAPNKRELTEIFHIHLRQAEMHAQRLDLFVPDLQQALQSNRQHWLQGVSKPGAQDASGIIRLATYASEYGLTGADVTEAIRLTLKERTMNEILGKGDTGPISSEDLMRHLKRYERNKSRLRAATDKNSGTTLMFN